MGVYIIADIHKKGLILFNSILMLLLISRYSELITGMYVNLVQVSIARWYMPSSHSTPFARQSLTNAISWLETVSTWEDLAPRHRATLLKLKAAQEQALYRTKDGLSVSELARYKLLKRARAGDSVQSNDDLVKLSPRYWVEQSAQSGNQHPVAEVLPGWRLLGYDLPGNPFLGLQNEVDIVLYWERDKVAPAPGMMDHGDWLLVWVGNRVYQIGRVTNLAPNDGFEHMFDLTDVHPVGWPAQQYVVNRPGDRALLLDQRHGVPAVVAYLDNASREASAWYSEPIPVEEDAVYLHAGKVSLPDE